MNQDEIRVGALIKHAPTHSLYMIEAIGKMKTPTGEWVEAARYRNVEPHSGSNPTEYYRALTNFGTFVLVIEDPSIDSFMSSTNAGRNAMLRKERTEGRKG